jgi:8-oxo-dGTP diphosphatase
MSAAPVITVAAALIVHPDGRILLVRKRGTTKWMQAGGKPESGETPVDTIVRELLEELELVVDPRTLEPLGRFETIAANEAGHALHADVFRLITAGPLRAAAEIDEAVWVKLDEARALPLAPLAVELLGYV